MHRLISFEQSCTAQLLTITAEKYASIGRRHLNSNTMVHLVHRLKTVNFLEPPCMKPSFLFERFVGFSQFNCIDFFD